MSSRNAVAGPPLSETKTLYSAIPEEPVASLPDQLTGNAVVFSTAGSGVTVLVGAELSIVTRACLVGSTPWLGSVSLTWSVAIAGLESKTMSATLRIWVPVARPDLGAMM